MKSFNKSILICISILFLTTNLYGTDWDFENPDGKPFLLTFYLNQIGDGDDVNMGLTLPISKWFTMKGDINQFDDFKLVENESGDFQLKKTDEIIYTTRLEFHIPLYKLWEK